MEEEEVMIVVDNKLFDYFFLEKISEDKQAFKSGIEYCEAIKAKIESEPMADIQEDDR